MMHCTIFNIPNKRNQGLWLVLWHALSIRDNPASNHQLHASLGSGHALFQVVADFCMLACNSRACVTFDPQYCLIRCGVHNTVFCMQHGLFDLAASIACCHLIAN